MGTFLEDMIKQCYKDRLKVELEKFCFDVHKSHIVCAEENSTGKDFHFSLRSLLFESVGKSEIVFIGMSGKLFKSMMIYSQSSNK